QQNDLSSSSSASNSVIMMQAYNCLGTAQGSNTIAYNSTIENLGLVPRVASPKVTSLRSGRYIITWHVLNTTTGVSTILAKRFNVGGTAFDATAFVVSEIATADQVLPSVTGLPDGTFVITWFGLSSSLTSDFNVLAKRY